MLFQLLSLWVESFCVTIQMKAIQQYFHVVLFIMLYKVTLTFEFASEWNPMVNHSNKTTRVVLSRTMYTLCFKWNLGFIMSFDSGLLKEPIDRKQTNKQILTNSTYLSLWFCYCSSPKLQRYDSLPNHE